MGPATRRHAIAALAALALVGCRVDDRAARREERAAEATAAPQEEVEAYGDGADAIESELDEIEALLAED